MVYFLYIIQKLTKMKPSKGLEENKRKKKPTISDFHLKSYKLSLSNFLDKKSLHFHKIL